GGRAAVLVNGQKVKHSHGPLTRHDLVEIGEYRIRVVNEDARTAPVAAANEPVAPPVPASPAPLAPAPSDSREIARAGDLPPEMNVWRARVHGALVKQMDLRRLDVRSLSDEALREATMTLIDEIMAREFADLPRSINPRRLAKQVLDEAIGLGPLEDLIDDNTVTEIMVNAFDQIYIERNGRIEKSEVCFTSERAVLSAIERIVTPLGRRIDESSPMVDARLKDGSRVNAIIPPVALRGASVSIRKFAKRKLTGEDLLTF